MWLSLLSSNMAWGRRPIMSFSASVVFYCHLFPSNKICLSLATDRTATCPNEISWGESVPCCHCVCGIYGCLNRCNLKFSSCASNHAGFQALAAVTSRKSNWAVLRGGVTSPFSLSVPGSFFSYVGGHEKKRFRTWRREASLKRLIGVRRALALSLIIRGLAVTHSVFI